MADEKLEQKATTNDMTDILQNLSNILKRTSASHRAIPSWDSSSQKSAVSIKSHIKLFESLAERMGWTEEEKALELILTLKGHARKYVESLENDITRDFEKLKQDLIQTFTRRKPEAQRLREWNACRWDFKSQTLTEFAAMLMSKLKKLNDDDVKTPDTELFLKNRFLEAIKDENPEFGRYLDLNRPEKQSFKDMVTFCQNKYDVFCAVEQEDDERKGSEIFFSKMNNFGRRTGYNHNEYPQFPYPFMWPFPFFPYPGQPNEMPQGNMWQRNRNDRQVQFKNNGAQERLDGNERYRNNQEQEKNATKVPKDHSIKYIQDTRENSKN